MLRFIKLTRSGEVDYYETSLTDYDLKVIEPTNKVGVVVFAGSEEDYKLDDYKGLLGVNITKFLESYNTDGIDIINLRGLEFIEELDRLNVKQYLMELIVKGCVSPREQYYAEFESELQRKGR